MKKKKDIEREVALLVATADEKPKNLLSEKEGRKPTQVCSLLMHTSFIYYIAACKYVKNVYFIYTNSCYCCSKKYFEKQLNL